MKTNPSWKSEAGPMETLKLDFYEEDERVDLERALKNCVTQDLHDQRYLIGRYQNASAHVQGQVRRGQMNLADLDERYFLSELKRKKRSCVKKVLLKMFQALLPYFGGKRKLCSIIFKKISEYLPREKWSQATFVDAFMGSGAVSLFAKAQGFRVIANDIAGRSCIAGKALIENNQTLLTDDDLHRLCFPNSNNKHLIEKEYSPDVFTSKHAKFLDNAFENARTDLDKLLLLKFIFTVRPYSKFTSPNAFNRPMEEGRFDAIKSTYAKHIKDNLKSPITILKAEKNRVNAGIFSNGHENRVSKMDVFDFVQEVEGDVFYCDSPYANTLSYESEYAVIDRILGDEALTKSSFSDDDGVEMLDKLLSRCQKFPLWVISFGNAGGKNELSQLVEIVSRYRKCEAKEFSYQHCGAMASEEHKKQSKEWVVIGHL